jgi:hypothetical protein
MAIQNVKHTIFLKKILHSPAKKFKNTAIIEEYCRYQNAFTNHTSSPHPKKTQTHTQKTPKPSPITTPENPSIKIFTLRVINVCLRQQKHKKKKQKNKKESKKNNSLR